MKKENDLSLDGSTKTGKCVSETNKVWMKKEKWHQITTFFSKSVYKFVCKTWTQLQTYLQNQHQNYELVYHARTNLTIADDFAFPPPLSAQSGGVYFFIYPFLEKVINMKNTWNFPNFFMTEPFFGFSQHLLTKSKKCVFFHVFCPKAVRKYKKPLFWLQFQKSIESYPRTLR